MQKPQSTKVLGIPNEIPILPIRNRVLFPGALLRLSIGRPTTVKLVKETVWDSHNSDRKPLVIGIFTLLSTDENKTSSTALGELDLLTDENYPEIYKVGTLARVVQLTRPRKNDSYQFSMLIQGLARIQVKEYIQKEPFCMASVSLLKPPNNSITKSLTTELRQVSTQLVSVVREKSSMSLLGKSRDLLNAIASSSPGELSDVLISNLDLMMIEKQYVLQTIDLSKRVTATLDLLKSQIDILNLSTKIQSQVEDRMNDTRKEYYLRQQLKAIREELGEEDGEETDDLKELQARFKKLQLPAATEKVVNKELKRLTSLQSAQPEYHVIRGYLEWLADLPWSIQTEDQYDVEQVIEQLESDHHGLHKVKKRIAEYVAVLSLKRATGKHQSGPILCLVGPPGVGKTSLGKSIATATRRAFQRISLGGVHDESEIRGHRRTYIGAMPGNVIHAIKRAACINPVILLDEIDKLGKGAHHGDPSSALLEVLDPAQNSTFTDHYLNTPFDLSKVMFIATANSLDTIPAPLLDRMEIIHVSGYIVAEKIAIAEKYLLQRQIQENGLTAENVSVPTETIEYIITRYTREAGVRALERKLGALCRFVAVQVVEWRRTHSKDQPFPLMTITIPMTLGIFGAEMFESEIALRTGCNGVATGLAWTSTGGEILFVEASLIKEGTGTLRLTGKLGDVMKESAQLALSWIQANCTESFDPKHDIHIHFPAGAVPKDGPSAGCAMIVALMSTLTGKIVPTNLAMTGEITLRGLVLPVGGIKEKILAAHRAGIQRVLLPHRNRKDVEQDIPSTVLESVDIQYVKTIGEVLEIVFCGEAYSLEAPVHRMTYDCSGPILTSSL